MERRIHKTEVPGSNPGWPTKVTVPEELSLRELVIMVLGEEGRRRMENRTKSNDQLFSEYFDVITNTHSPASLYEAKRLLSHFKEFLGNFPPTTELAAQFLD